MHNVMLSSLTIADKMLFIFLVAVTVCSFFLVWSILPDGSTVIVEVDGAVRYRAELLHDAEFSVRGVRGQVSVQVKEGSVGVVDADCPNRICIRTGFRQRSGDVIVCVPNKAIIKIGGKKSGDVHAVTG